VEPLRGGPELAGAAGLRDRATGTKPAEPEAELDGVQFLPRDDDEAVERNLGERSKRWEQLFFKNP